jgi:hypothetical protein
MANGWRVVPLPPRAKAPAHKSWRESPPTLGELPRWFAVAPGAQSPNIGLLLGPASGGLVDVDCDTREAALAAAVLLPATDRISGRAGHPRSHYWYVCHADSGDKRVGEGGLPRVAFAVSSLPHRERGGGNEEHISMLVELRGDGCQTVAPPSIHPSGERIRWEREGEPAVVAYDGLKAAVGRVAACALLARAWPAVGQRDEAAMALTGMLLRGGWTTEATDSFVQLVARIAGDEEWRQRAKGESGRERLDTGERVMGGTALSERLVGDGAAIVVKVRQWLGVREDISVAARTSPSLQGGHIQGMTFLGDDDHLGSVLVADVQQTELRWLWQSRIPLGALTLLDGDPGLGKSLVTLDLIARVTTGREMPDGTPGVDGGALLLSAEDDLGATIRPRLVAARADLGRVRAVQSVRVWDAEAGRVVERFVSLPGDIHLLATAMEQVGAKLVVIDPLMAYLNPRVNSWRDQDVRTTLAPLARLAQEQNVAVVILRHLTKGSGGNALYRGGGSIGIIGAARSGLLIAKHPDNPEHERVLASSKSNLGPPVQSLRYRLQPGDGQDVHVEWLGPCDFSATALLATEQDTRKPSAIDEATTFLADYLSEGPQPQMQVLRAARGVGISETTLNRARVRLGAKPRHVGFHADAHWVWELPPQQTDEPSKKVTIAQEGHPTIVTSLERDGSLGNATRSNTPALCPETAHGAHEYALLRDARGRRACIHCHTIEGTDEKLQRPKGDQL